jgi:hypothetical protein
VGSGSCLYRDEKGGQLWASSEIAGEGKGASALGVGTWTGVTGRFEGASGEMNYASTFAALTRARAFRGKGLTNGILVLPSN